MNEITIPSLLPPIGLKWRPITEAKKDSTLYDLIVVEVHPETGELIVSTSMGFNAHDTDGIDVWQYVGWNPLQNSFAGTKSALYPETQSLPVLFMERPQDDIDDGIREAARSLFQAFVHSVG